MTGQTLDDPMALAFEEIGAIDIERLAAWMPQYQWPYHARAQVDEAWVRERAAAGHFFGSDARSFWIVQGGSSPLGIVRAFELSDTTPLLDLRIADAARGRGVGTEVLRWVTSLLFQSFPETQRVGGYTRADNLPMRRVFDKCSFLQEARHRRAWRVHDGTYFDAVGYAALRSDWLSGTTTPVVWP